MMKQVPKSERIQALVAKATGDTEASLDNLAVYEAIIANNNPIRKNGLYRGAVLGQDTMAALVDGINSGDHIPLQLMHRSGSLPVGKVFHAEMKPTKNGGTQVNALFYLPKNDSQHVHKIDAGVINDVSVGFLPKQLMCSACGFDFMGDSSTFSNIYDCKCDQGHTIGKDGVHARVHGVAAFHELSLVDKGGVPGAFILPRAQQSLGVNPNMARLKADGIDEQAFCLFASQQDFNPAQQEVPTMDMEKFIALSADFKVAERDLTTLRVDLAARDTTITDLNAKLADMSAKLAAASVTDMEKLNTDLKLAMELITEMGTATLSAMGKKEAVPEVTSEAVAFVRKARLELAAVLPAGGKGVSASQSEQDGKKPDFSSFKRS